LATTEVHSSDRPDSAKALRSQPGLEVVDFPVSDRDRERGSRRGSERQGHRIEPRVRRQPIFLEPWATYRSRHGSE
jgi:hypothetical protein